ncbi:MAG: glycosyltransferase family 4 protein [Sphaerochaetaceae bacterium]|nr:glycosyltransferase family 4 protein [Sphaerochaetaceae bacterium]
MNKDILFLCQFFYPEHVSSATLPFDTAKYLAANGFTVDALVGYPKEYTHGENFPLDEVTENVGIHRIKYIELDRKKTINRLINYFSFTGAALLNIGRLKNYQSVVVYSNPPVLPIVPILAHKLFKTKFVFVAYDVYPEIAYASKTLSPGSLIDRVMSRINHHLYKHASHIVTLTDEMKEFLLKKRPELDADRVTTIANWAHEKELKPDHEAYQRFGYADGLFVVSYFGNMGTCQDVDTMMGAAEQLDGDDRIKFLIVGHGNKKAEVEKRAGKLKNVQVIDFLTGRDFEQAVAVSSCCIVSLEKGLMGTCAPSKYYSYLQGGQPVLAVVEKGSYLYEEVEREQIGYSIEVGDILSLKNAILELADNQEDCEAMGQRAKILYEREYNMDVAFNKYANMFSGIVGNRE